MTKYISGASAYSLFKARFNNFTVTDWLISFVDNLICRKADQVKILGKSKNKMDASASCHMDMVNEREICSAKCKNFIDLQTSI